MQTRWLTVRQVARHYNCSMDVIYGDLQSGRIEGEKIVKNGKPTQRWTIDRTKLPVSRDWGCSTCGRIIGLGDSKVITNIRTTVTGRREVRGTDGRFCSDACLSKRYTIKPSWQNFLGGLINGRNQK